MEPFFHEPLALPGGPSDGKPHQTQPIPPGDRPPSQIRTGSCQSDATGVWLFDLIVNPAYCRGWWFFVLQWYAAQRLICV
jgi:hypothetical protein